MRYLIIASLITSTMASVYDIYLKTKDRK